MGEGGDKIRELIEMSKEEDDVALDENPNIISFAVTVGGNVIGIVVTHRKTTSVEDINWVRARGAKYEQQARARSTKSEVTIDAPAPNFVSNAAPH